MELENTQIESDQVIPEAVEAVVEEPKNVREDINNDVKAAVEAIKDRVRAPDGKFAKDTAPKTVEQPKAEVKPITAQDTTKAPVETVSTPSVAPPVSWAADAKAAFNTLSPAVQQAVLKREKEVSDGFAQKSEELKRYDAVLSPVREMGRRYGVDPGEAINRLVAANDYLERDPRAGIQWLAQAYNVDLTQPFNTQAVAPQQQPQVIPEVQQLTQRLEAFEMSQAEQQIEIFSKNPENKYFQELKPIMGDLMSKGAAATLNEAYEKAAWLNQDVRNRMLAERDAEAEAKRKQELSSKASNAKRAAVSVRGSPTQGNLSPKSGSVGSARDDVRAAFEKLRSEA